MENTSGQGSLAAVPPEIDRWNWGAFLLNWIWGIGNNTFIALLVFVPFVGFVMPFVLGVKGSAWAWRNKRWDSVEHFLSVQRKWAKWAAIIYLLLIALFAASMFFTFTALKNSDVYTLAVSRIEANPEAMSQLGAPITTGIPTGNFQISGPSGQADFSFSVEGQKNRGTVFVDATRDMGTWKIKRMELELEGSRKRINLNDTSTV
ncbi:MAG: hypothetical protein A3I66_07125 [Burkholderiales bacterium RIFCSPLOWO2_02_FULL_57_36]|nr:MAG: hypothetical protein A3I66_07125 [Burkholderiales bacterium RIFCSPLOWO2_02_FULL_57_36]